MLEEPDAALTNLTPYLFAGTLGLTVSNDKSGDSIENPRTGRPLYLTESEFINTDPSCSFRAGNVVDFYKYLHGCTYKEAVEYMFDNHSSLLVNTSTYGRDYHVDEVTAHHEAHAAVYEHLFSLNTNLSNTERFAIENQNLIRQNIDPIYLRNSVFQATPEQMEYLVSLCEPESEHELNHNSYCLYPYFRSYGRIGHIVVKSVYSDLKLLFNLKILPSKISYFGLHKLPPGFSNVNVYVDRMDALETDCWDRRHMGPQKQGDGIYHLAIKTTNAPRPPAVYLKNVTFRHKETEELSGIAMLRNFCGTFAVKPANRALAAAPRSWSEFLAGRLANMPTSDEMKILSTLKEVGIDHTTYKELLAVFRASKRLDLVKLLERVKNRNRIATIQMGTIEETTTGYVFAKLNSNLPAVLFTNFTINLTRCITYRNYNPAGERVIDIKYKGTLHVNDDDCDITLSPHEINNPRLLASKVESLSAEKGFKTTALITELSFLHRLSDFLNQTRASIPRYDGISRLGWDPLRQTFTTATWECAGRHIIHHKNAEVANKPIMDKFKFNIGFCRGTQHLAVKATTRSNSDVITVLSLIAGYIVRSFLKLPMPVTPFRNNPRARNLLSSAFSALGQYQKPIYVHSNRREGVSTIVECLFGYPFWGHSDSPEAVKKIVAAENDSPLCLLADTGLQISSRLTTAEHYGVADKAAVMLQKLAQWLISTRGIDLNDLAVTGDMLSVEELIQVGLHAVQKSWGEDWKIEGAQHTSLAYYIYRLEHPEKYFRIDFKSQRVRMSHRHVSRGSLKDAALVLDSTAEFENFYIWFDARRITDYLKLLLDKDVEIQEYTQPKSTGSKVVDIDTSLHDQG